MISEKDIIKLVRNKIPGRFYDDVGFEKYINGKYILMTIDTFVKSTDAPPAMAHYYIGWKSVISSISDVFVKGGQPKYLCISLNISKPDAGYIDQIASGIKDAVDEYGLEIVKWDTNKSLDLSITVSVLGFSDRKPILRKDIEKNDLIIATDYFGLERLGLDILLGKIKIMDKELENDALSRFLKPYIDYQKYRELFSKYTIHAAIDSSDGLIRSLWELSRASNKKIKLINIPIHPNLKKVNLEKKYVDEIVLYGGEEYIGIFSIPKNEVDKHLEKSVVILGEVIDEGIGVFDINGRMIEEKGWLHIF